MPTKTRKAASSRKRTAKNVKVRDLVPKKDQKGGLNYSKIEVDYRPKP